MSALQKLIERQANGEKLTSLEFAVFWCTDRVCAENAAVELAEFQAWKQAIDDACAVDWIEATTPKETIQKLISVNVQQALDPAISEQPAKWVARITDLKDALKPFAEIPCLENFDDDQLFDPAGGVLAGDVRKARIILNREAQ